jgi:hypothetical protein
MINIIKQKNKTLGLTHNNRHYIIGFPKLNLARKVHYNIHPEPNLTLIRGDMIIHEDIEFDTSSTLFIPKCKGSIWEPMNDGCFHLSHMKKDEFYILPGKNRIGIIIPYNLEEETEDQFMFKVSVVNPIN